MYIIKLILSYMLEVKYAANNVKTRNKNANIHTILLIF